MKISTAESIDPQADVIRGIEPHPEFNTFSDERLKLHEALIDQKILWAKEDHDDMAIHWYEIEMAMLQADRARRNGGSNSFPHLGDKTVRNKFQAQTWGEFIEAVPDAEEFSIEGIMPAQGLGVLGGRGKEAKSTLIIHAARAIADGCTFLGKATLKRPVLYLNYEMPHGYLKKLLRAGGEPPAEAHVLNRPEPLLQLETVDYLFQTLVPAGVIIIDSFRGAF